MTISCNFLMILCFKLWWILSLLLVDIPLVNIFQFVVPCLWRKILLSFQAHILCLNLHISTCLCIYIWYLCVFSYLWIYILNNNTDKLEKLIWLAPISMQMCWNPLLYNRMLSHNSNTNNINDWMTYIITSETCHFGISFVLENDKGEYCWDLVLFKDLLIT